MRFRIGREMKVVPLLAAAFIYTAAAVTGIILTGGPESSSSLPRVIQGNESFCARTPGSIKGKRIGLVVNHSSLLPDGKHLVDVLLDKQLNIGAIFSPEHGFSGSREGGEEVRDGKYRDVPIISLYDDSRRPLPEECRAIDVFVYDIQDVGTRFYTYISTLKFILEAGAEHDIPVIILDRPNPAGGEIIEGPLLVKEQESFIGSLPIPIRYGMTIGELAQMMCGEGWVPRDVSIQIIRLKNWRRQYFWSDTGLAWIPTSPNMPTPETALAYSGIGFFGPLRLSEGVGTSSPFLIFGAPWLEPHRLPFKQEETQARWGITIRASSFTPRSLPGKVSRPRFMGTVCFGFEILIHDPARFHSLRFMLHMVDLIRTLYPDRMNPNWGALDRMFGTSDFSRYLKGNLSFSDLKSAMQSDEQKFRKMRTPYLLYR